ncbi:unnamed protein product, partial [Staurois parvus]
MQGLGRPDIVNAGSGRADIVNAGSREIRYSEYRVPGLVRLAPRLGEHFACGQCRDRGFTFC